MYIYAGKWRYRLRPIISQTLQICIEESTSEFTTRTVLTIVDLEAIEYMHRKDQCRSTPQYACVCDQTLFLHPTPQKVTKLHLTYYPPAQIL